jgi:RNase H-fold protein (predicted Holliday junction resolvase)
MSGEAANNPLWLNFVEQLKAKGGKPVNFLDERLSSLAADALSGEKKEKAERDEIAATIILQDYLDSN